MVGHVVNEHLDVLTVFGALNQIADAGFAGIIRREARRIGQHGLHHFQRNDFLSFGGLHRLFG